MSEAKPFGLSTTFDGLRALNLIAAHAQSRMGETGPGGKTDKLLGWESRTEFGRFKITVRCDCTQPSQNPKPKEKHET